MNQVRIILPNTSCNLHCAYCLDGYYREKECIKTDIDINKTLDKLALYRFNNIGLWGGEPLTNPYLFTLLDKIRNVYPDKEIGLLTNGTLLNEKNIERLNFYKVNVGISHDAFNQKYRCKDFLTSMYLQRLNLLKRFNGFNTVVHKYNCDLVGIVKWFKSLPIKHNYQVTFELFKVTDDNFIDFMPSVDEYRQLFKSYKEILKMALDGEILLQSELWKARNCLKGKSTTSCGAENRLSIDLNGKIWHCQVASEINYIEPINNSIPTMCEGCNYAFSCRGICPLLPERFRKKLCMVYHLYYDAIHETLEK